VNMRFDTEDKNLYVSSCIELYISSCTASLSDVLGKCPLGQALIIFVVFTWPEWPSV
jgi:hypothetical protein